MSVLTIGETEQVVTVTSRSGVRFLVRLLHEGDFYGASLSLVAEKATVEFYDTRYQHTTYGQFVSRYYVDTLLDDHILFHQDYSAGGLNLDGDVDDWHLDAAAMDVVRAWLRLEVSRETVTR